MIPSDDDEENMQNLVLMILYLRGTTSSEVLETIVEERIEAAGSLKQATVEIADECRAAGQAHS